MKKAIYLCMILTTLFVACEKENQEVSKSTRELLVEKKWYQTAILINPPLMGMSNQFDSLIPCQKDDIFTYRNSGKMEIATHY